MGRTTHTPDVSVVIPAYRQAHLLAECLDSVAAQTFTGRVEAIVVDDGSPDGAADVAEAHPIGAVVLRTENRGVAEARNAGIARARGKYVAFLDADDRWHADKLRRQVACLEAYGEPAMCFTQFRRIKPDGVPIEVARPSWKYPETAHELSRRNFVGCSTVVVHRACLERVGGFPADEVLRNCAQDYALWLRIAAYFPMIYVRSVLSDYMVHPGNRVGADHRKHFRGGMHALAAFRNWEPERFRKLVGPYPLLLAERLWLYWGALSKLERDRRSQMAEFIRGSEFALRDLSPR